MLICPKCENLIKIQNKEGKSKFGQYECSKCKKTVIFDDTMHSIRIENIKGDHLYCSTCEIKK